MKQLYFRGHFELNVVDNKITIPGTARRTFRRGTYTAFEASDQRYRFLGVREGSKLRAIKEWLKIDPDTLEVKINNYMEIPTSAAEYLGLLSKDQVIVAPSFDYLFAIWEPDEFRRHQESLTEAEILDIEERLSRYQLTL